MRIYTKYGDQGNTQLLGGQQTRKNDIRVAVCGTLDELNAVLGMVASQELPAEIARQLTLVQSDLFSIGSLVAALGAEVKIELPETGDEPVEQLERQIDALETQLKPLKNFLLPGGSPSAATMHLARAVCRRAERLLTELTDRPEFQDARDLARILKYLNRLSDWCFVAARSLNHRSGVDEPIWNGNA